MSKFSPFLNHLQKLKSFFFENKRLPSYSELARLIGVKSKSTAQYFVNRLLKLGWLLKDEMGKLIPGKIFFPVKLLGTVQAGFPSPAEEENADTISLDDWLIANKEASFMLKVSGDSMTEAGIMPGDMVIIERGKDPKNGDIIVAEVDREWTIKYFEKSKGEVLLKPANKNYPVIKAKEEMRMAGVVMAVIRKY